MKKREKNEVKTEGENGVEPVPAPSADKKKRGRRIWGWILASLVLIGAFFCGMGVRWWTIEPEMRALIDAKNKIDDEYYWGISDEEFYGALFDTLNDDLLDRYSAYMTAEETAADEEGMAGNRSGVGLEFLTKDENGDDQILISRVCGNSPAEEAGLRVGDRIVGYGKVQTELSMDENSEKFLSFLDLYKEKEEFCLCVDRNGERQIFTLAKKAYVESNVFYRTSTEGYAFTGENAEKLTKRGDALSVLPEDTAYIRLVKFGGNAVEGFKTAMTLFRAQGKKNLVLDLRGNGGGYLGYMQEIAAYFCKTDEKKPVVAVADYGEKKEEFTSSNVYANYFSKDSRICVIADKYSASASECLMGCMLDYNTISYADICLIERGGEAKTFGKGIMQSTYTLSLFRGDSLRLTTARILWPLSGNCIHERGILASDGTEVVAQDYENEGELTNAISALF